VKKHTQSFATCSNLYQLYLGQVLGVFSDSGHQEYDAVTTSLFQVPHFNLNLVHVVDD
jgi:ACR3 family arsenite efflux pump ArsB